MEMDNTEIVAELRRIIGAYFDYARIGLRE